MQLHPVQIGSLQIESPLILAPMAGITNLPYRRIMKKAGAALVFSEMISANGLIRNGRQTLELLESVAEEKPLAIQLFGENPLVLAQAVEMIADQAQLIDINMGCPVKKVIRSGAGSALMRAPQKIGDIVTKIRQIYTGPLSIKLRSGWDQPTSFLEAAQRAEDAGVDAICLHPRTRAQGFSGTANWELIKQLKATVHIPVIGSGDLLSAAQVVDMHSKTGCDAMMIARGSYGNPWIFTQSLALLQQHTYVPPSTRERWETIACHIQWHLQQFGEHKALREMRKHLCWYARGWEGASRFRSSLQQIQQIQQLIEISRSFFLNAKETQTET